MVNDYYPLLPPQRGRDLDTEAWLLIHSMFQATKTTYFVPTQERAEALIARVGMLAPVGDQRAVEAAARDMIVVGAKVDGRRYTSGGVDDD